MHEVDDVIARGSQVTPSWERQQYWREGLELKKYADSLGKGLEKQDEI